MLYFRAIVVLAAIFLCVAACSRRQPVPVASAQPSQHAYSLRSGAAQDDRALNLEDASAPEQLASEQQFDTEPVAALAPSRIVKPTQVEAAPQVYDAPSPPARATTSSAPSDDAIRAAIIQRSIASYYGSCPCPYSTDRAGRRCGGRSAHSRPGGASPLCFPSDVSDEMVSAYQAKASADAKPSFARPCAENGSCYGDISTSTGRPKTVPVSGYYRKDGTYVRGHYRSRPSY